MFTDTEALRHLLYAVGGDETRIRVAWMDRFTTEYVHGTLAEFRETGAPMHRLRQIYVDANLVWDRMVRLDRIKETILQNTG